MELIVVDRKRNSERICQVRKDDIEDEVHVVPKWNAYQEERKVVQEPRTNTRNRVTGLLLRYEKHS